MIYFTTFILALFLSQIARAAPACGDAIPPELPTPVEQYIVPMAGPTVVKHNHKYDDPNASTNSVVCKNLHKKFHRFHNFPTFPFIGGAFDIGHSPGPNCGGCWRLHNLKNNHTRFITAIDHADHGFVISDEAFKKLDDGHLSPELRHVDYFRVPAWHCGL